ncbi:MAG TPA: ABC transporter substrate-binding protein [Rhodopila sp.]|uniref:ABC transporter substrate-binding protein n=1 Tax=Rhodopila sp. TaxID=2480087 RepID=UPI002C2582EA|nr:ABC transporter substrate-binding protein [Rhodopila sp.]HVY14823.1 ABC transporter substrate-binding protein [Rhodopila sp.]
MIVRTLLFLLLVLAFGPSALAGDTLRLGLLHTLSPAPFYIAQERGYFRDQGIDLSFRFFDAAQPIAAAAVSGDVDVGVTALTGGFFNLAEKGTLKVIGGGLHEEKGYEGAAILASDKAYDAGLTSLAKLPGHSFAITQYGSSFHYMVGRIAEAEGFDIKSVTLRPVQTVANMLAALSSDQVDATIAIASQAKPLAAAGHAHILAWAGDVVPYQLTAVFTTPGMIANKPDLLRRFAAAYRKGVADYRDAFLCTDAGGHPVVDAKTDAAVALVTKYVFTGDPDARRKILQGVGYYDKDGALDVKDVLNQIAWFKAQGLVKGDLDPSAMLDTHFLPAR